MAYSNDLAVDFNQINKSNLDEAISSLYESSRQVNDARWQECKYNHNICYGPDFRKKNFYVNLCESQVNSILGASARAKKMPQFIATGEVDEATISQFNKLYISCSSRFNYHETLMEARRQATVYGECLLQVFPDFTLDPINPHPNIKVLSYSRYATDDQWRCQDMSDASFIITSEFLTKPYAAELFPDHKKEIQDTSNRFFVRNNMFGFSSQNQLYNQTDIHNNLVRVVYLWVRTEEVRECVYNIHTGEKNYDTFDRELVKNSYDQGLRIVKFKGSVWKQGIMVGDVPVYFGLSQYGFDECPFVACTFDRMYEVPPKKPKSRSFVAKIRDTVQITSRKIVKDNEFLESSNNNILVANKSKIVNHQDLYRQDVSEKVLFTKTSTDKPQDLVFKLPYQGLSISDLAVTKNDIDVLSKVSGVTDDMMGTAPSQRVSSLTSAMRLEESHQQFSLVFDRWHNVSKDVGRLVLRFVQSNWEAWQLRREIQEDPTADFFSERFGNYSVALTEGEYSESQRNVVFQQLLELIQYAPESIPPSLLISLSNLQDKDKILNMLQKLEEDKRQMDQQKLQIDLAKAKSEIEINKANTLKLTELAKEREDRQYVDLARAQELIAKTSKISAEAAKTEADGLKILSEIRQSKEEFDRRLQKIELAEQQLEEKINNQVQRNRAEEDALLAGDTPVEQPPQEQNSLIGDSNLGDITAGQLGDANLPGG